MVNSDSLIDYTPHLALGPQNGNGNYINLDVRRYRRGRVYFLLTF